VIALFPAVFSSLILILMPRIGGRATAAVLANGQWGLIGFGAAIVVLHLAAEPLGRAAALGLALATCVAWNFGLWVLGRYRLRAIRSSSPP
jgi:ABC-type spermidine/putrescine transport system permease subunit I